MNDNDVIIYVSQDKSALESDPTSGFALLTTEPRNESFSDLHADGSGRGWIDGVMDLNIIRENTYSTDLVFNNIDYDYYVEILNNIKNMSDGGFYASVFNDELGKRVVMHMYRADRKFSKHRYRSGWRVNLSLSIVQY